MQSQNITIIGVNYAPEDSAIGLYSTQMAEYLRNKSKHNVSVVTGFPYYPQWSISSAYKAKKRWYKEVKEGVLIFRYKQYVPKNPTFIKRILHLLSFTFGSLPNVFKPNSPSLVICIIPFTSSALLGLFLKWRYRNSKLWIHIQDFEFDAAIDSGLISGNKKIIFKLLLKLERFLLNRADKVSTISNAMLEVLQEKSSTATYYFPNWLDVSAFNNTVLKNHKLIDENKFTILYSGNIGAKQDWDFFFEFIEQLKNLKAVEVVLVGEGAKETEVKERAQKSDLITCSNLVPFEELPQLLQSADLHILFQKNEVIDTVMPSKILGMMGSARPSIVTGNLASEVKKVFDQSKGGFYYQNTELKKIINKINELSSNALLCKEVGYNAKNFVVTNYNKDTILERFNEAINNLY